MSIPQQPIVNPFGNYEPPQNTDSEIELARQFVTDVLKEQQTLQGWGRSLAYAATNTCLPQMLTANKLGGYDELNRKLLLLERK